jgi:hypothetical protein
MQGAAASGDSLNIAWHAVVMRWSLSAVSVTSSTTMAAQRVQLQLLLRMCHLFAGTHQ